MVETAAAGRPNTASREVMRVHRRTSKISDNDLKILIYEVLHELSPKTIFTEYEYRTQAFLPDCRAALSNGVIS
jgi:hypothetical protein